MDRDSTDRVRRSIERQHRATLRQRIDEQILHGSALASRMRALAEELSRWLGALKLMRAELDQAEETTISLPISRPGDETTRRMRSDHPPPAAT